VCGSRVHVWSSRVSEKERKKERRRWGDSCLVRRWPAGLGGGRRARLTSSLEVKASFEQVLDTRFEEVCHARGDFHCLSLPRTTIGFLKLVQSLRDRCGLHYCHRDTLSARCGCSHERPGTRRLLPSVWNAHVWVLGHSTLLTDFALMFVNTVSTANNPIHPLT